MPENRLLSESDLWFSPSQMKEGAKNALLYPFRNPEQVAEAGLSIAPGSGEAMSARDAWNASGRAGNALLQGNFGEAASGYGDMALGIMGALPGAGIIARGTRRGAAWMDRNLPAGVNRLLDSITPSDPRNTTFIFAGPTAKPGGYKLSATSESPSGHKDINVVKDGQVVARIQAHLDKKGDMFINNIAGFDGEKWTDFRALSNKIGARGIIQIRDELQKMFPKIKSFSGDRVGGSRAEAMPFVKMKASSK